MSERRILSFYLEPGLKKSAEAGEHNFLGKVADVARAADFEIFYYGNGPEEREKSLARPGFALFHMEPPTHGRGVTVRRAYCYPFWSIERTEKRWDFDVAQSVFDGGDVPRQEAARFAGFWRRRLFGAWPDNDEKGHVYIALQGRLLEQRSFQSCAPVEMLRAVLRHERERPVVAGLHPNEAYSRAEMQALEKLVQTHPNLGIRTGGMEALLPGAAYVVTQNSSVGFMGLFHARPLVLFGRADFHHIALKTWEIGVEEALRQAPGHAPDFEGYLWWFWQKMAINAGRPEAEEKIALRLRDHGWPV
ncbi:capsular polysaccharide export protein, LipB/KpsS family [Aquicoccus porphyridii]|uniref:capsular polysaccharide export protein, LipB/KpsS family n=1 Tax=Aquicoccus porphyridii TaxID=1852029 RepID=UPI00273F6D57|nr:hypothetical protein [Aquicoccus porphyridii]